MSRPLRLAVVVQHPIHYHLVLYRAMEADPDIDAEVLFMQRAHSTNDYDPELDMVVDWGVPMFEGFTSRVFRNISPWRNGEGFWKFINPGLVWRVLTGPYDAVYIHGNNHLSHILCMVAARVSGKRLIQRSISYNLGDRTGPKKFVRTMIYRLLYRLPNICLYIGAHNRAYFEAFGVPDTRLVYAPHIVDNETFGAQARTLENRKDEIKSAFGIDPGQSIILYAAKFLAKKQPLKLIEAFCEADLGADWTLLMIGEGPLKADAVALAARYPDKNIRFAGFLDQSEIGRAYVVADMVALPSAFQETWGLVVNEAMNFGCAVVISDRVGCGPDLVADKCGLIVPHDDGLALAEAIRRLATDEPLRLKFRARALATIKDWNAEAYMAGLRSALGLPADQVSTGR